MDEVGAAVEVEDEADVGSIAFGAGGGDRADIAALEVGFGVADAGFGDMADGQSGDACFDAGHGAKEGGVGAQVAVKAPLGRHFVDRAVQGNRAGDIAGDVGGESATLVVGEDFLEVVHAAEVGAIAAAVAVAFEFDEAQHVLGSVRRCLVADHA